MDWPTKHGPFFFEANDGIRLCYQELLPLTEPRSDKVIILLHGWTGSSNVWGPFAKWLYESFRLRFRLIGLDLRGHGDSDKPENGYHVSRLAMDLRNLIKHLNIPIGNVIGIGASLGCAVLWSYLELFGPGTFSELVFVDQSPFQNYTADGTWGPQFGSKGCNSAATLAYLQAQLAECPEKVYGGLVNTCLAYRSHPEPTDAIDEEQRAIDDHFFLNIAKKGNPRWFGKLMADHTNIDWRDSITHSLGRNCRTRVLVVASSRSGCFNPEGPLEVIQILERVGRKPGAENRDIKGVTIDWGGHWCYWEEPSKFNDLIQDFLQDEPEEIDVLRKQGFLKPEGRYTSLSKRREQNH